MEGKSEVEEQKKRVREYTGSAIYVATLTMDWMKTAKVRTSLLLKGKVIGIRHKGKKWNAH